MQTCKLIFHDKCLIPTAHILRERHWITETGQLSYKTQCRKDQQIMLWTGDVKDLLVLSTQLASCIQQMVAWEPSEKNALACKMHYSHTEL